jgi:hypothetical protein
VGRAAFVDRRDIRILLLLLAYWTPAFASAGDEPRDWVLDTTLYFWAAGIDGRTTGGADVDVGFDKLLDNLNMAFMGAVEARRGLWSVGVDAIYLNVGANGGGTVPIRTAAGAAGDLDVSASVETKGWILSPYAARTLLTTERASLDALLGVRYLDLTLDFDLGLRAGGYGVAPRLSASQTTWDAVVGVKGELALGGDWFLPYYADVGTGQSDLTWQLAAGVGYRLDSTELTLQYRHIAWDFDADDAVDRIAFSGPMLSAGWTF